MTAIRTAWLLLAICSPIGSIDAQTVSGPTLDPSYAHLGAVGHREERTVEFTVSNPGKTPLEFTKVKESCSCMTVDFDARPLPPGESRRGSVKVSFGRSFGEFHKQIDFRTRGRSAPISFHIFAKLHPGVRCSNLETVLEGFVGSTAESARDVIELQSLVPQLPGPEVTNLRWKVGGEHLRAKLLETEGDTTRIEITYADNHPEGPVRGELNAEIAGRLFVMPVRGHVYRGIRPNPPNCNFNVVRNPDDFVEVIELIPEDGTNFQVLSTKFEARARAAKITPKVEVSPRDGGGVLLTVSIEPGEGVKGGLGGKLTIETDHPEKKSLTLQIFGHIP